MVNAVMKAGYCHLDTANIYQNEEVVGEALMECFKQGKKREDIFVTTKLWTTGWSDVEAACRESLAKLQLEQVDLYLVHWPVMFYAKKPLHVLWPEMEALIDKGLTKSIGVSNFNTQLIWDLLTYCKIKPVANQIELNPQCPQVELVRFLKA